MRILYVSQYFPPEVGAPAARVHELSREWVRQGHDVTVLTAFPHHPTGVKRPQDRHVLTRREQIDGINVIRTYVYAAANRGTYKRMLSYASFMLSAMTIGRLRVARPDVVIATSPQLLCGLAGYVLARTLRARFVLEVRDLWPESILAVEALKESVLIRLLKILASFLYQHCDRIVTVGEGYRKSIHRRYRVSESKMDVVRNGIDPELFVPLPRNNEVRQAYGWGDRFVIMYLGTHGMAHDLRQVLEAARAMQADVDHLFVFVGEGAEKDVLCKQAQEWKLGNVQFIGQQPKCRVPYFYAACDLGLVTLRNSSLFQEVLPSKIFEFLGMGRAVLLNVDGEARQLVETAAAGEFFPPNDVEALVAAIRRLSSDAQRLTEMGQNGRQYVLKHFDRRRLAKDYLDILSRI
jgi:glycosyltransferase involved in cell wall biosynthesis